MNCFNHLHSSAVGICRVCSRGLCLECAVDLSHSLSCKGEHEERASNANEVSLRSIKILKVTKKSMFLGPIFFGVCGSVFFFDGLKRDGFFSFGSYLGLAFLAFALANLVANIRAYGGKKKIMATNH
jgi:hypothetical protein